MKCIYPTKITAVAADSFDPNYPAENVLDDHPSLPWVAGGQLGTVTLEVAGGSSGLAIFSANALAIAVTVLDAAGLAVFEVSYDLSGIDTWYKFFTQTGVPETELGVIYPYQSSGHTVVITADSGDPLVPVEIGVVRAGPVRKFRPPTGLRQEAIDYSIRKTLSSGAVYRKKKSVVRCYSGEVRTDLGGDFQVLMLTIIKEIGTAPLAWWVTEQEGSRGLVYAGFRDMPGGRFNNRYGMVNFTLLEEI